MEFSQGRGVQNEYVSLCHAKRTLIFFLTGMQSLVASADFHLSLLAAFAVTIAIPSIPDPFPGHCSWVSPWLQALLQSAAIDSDLI